MRTFFIRYGKIFAIFVSFAVGIALIVSAVFMLGDYKTEITDRATAVARYNTETSLFTVENALKSYVNDAVGVAGKAEMAKSEQELKDLFDTLVKPDDEHQSERNYRVVTIRYFKDGVLLNYLGDPYLGSADTSVLYRTKSGTTPGYAGSFTENSDETTTQMLAAFYAPIENPLVFADKDDATVTHKIDGVVLYYTRECLTSVFSDTEKYDTAEFSLLCSADGTILVGENNVKSPLIMTGDSVHSGNIVDILRSSEGKKAPMDKLRALLSSKRGGVVEISVGTKDYLISVGADEEVLHDLAIVEAYEVDVLCASGLEFVSAVNAIIVLFSLIVISAIIYLLLHNLAMSRKLLHTESYNTVLDCYNRHGFETAAATILEMNKTSHFNVIVLRIRHFNHFEEKCSKIEILHLLRFIRMALFKMLQEEEIFGYGDDGQFLILFHAKNRDELETRFKPLSLAISKYKPIKNIMLVLRLGIYERDLNDKLSVTHMIDLANELNNTPSSSEATGLSVSFYDEELRRLRLINEDMEMRMESALASGEFQVFYQPKYNLVKNVQDGCEALVRWYDIKEGVYNRPALFMTLFEQNGFIVKLDKYVFEKVCEYINYSIARGRTIYPVSVNVSRATAIQPDFLDFYVKTKKKYGVSDNLLMIEFTESFAYENYETLNRIVGELHKNGFKCSIDDFGVGYSSYKILKSLNMDEIKLDRFFMEDGFDHARDQNIFESIILLAKKLKMKVTQEGVETQAGVDRLRALGCDVIQGFVYSHPLPVSDYITFVQHSREHNLK